MHKWKWIAGILLISTALWGCGSSGGDAEMAAAPGAEIEVQKDGSIVETITEEFAKDYYDETNLEDMLLSEVADFNGGLAEGEITVEKFESGDGKLTIQMKYPSANAYTAYNTDPYNHRSLFCGTVGEAQKAGYSFDISMSDADGKGTIGKDDILGMGSAKILIAESPSRAKLPGKVLYMGEHVESLGKNRVDMQADENGDAAGTYYIIYK